MSKKKHKRKLNIGHILICLLVLGLCIFGGIKLKKFLFPQKHVVSGTITEVTDNTITVSSNEDTYTFKHDSTDDYVVGSELNISYSGNLKDNQVQSGKVNDIDVVNVPNFREDKIQELMSNMTLEEKVGQLFIVRCPDSNEVSVLQQYKLGGYILFANNFEYETTESIQAKLSSFQENSSIPMLIGVDEEGGYVTRISKYSQYGHEQFKSPQTLYSLGGIDKIISDTYDKCSFLKNLGVNVNFAPVADISTNSEDFIYNRTLGQDADSTSEYIRNVTRVMKEENVGSVLKHFPGYGNNTDTHTGIAYDNRSLDSFYSNDFKPFEAGISEGANMILVSHNIVACMDENTPASLSKNVHDILRNDLGFNGVIMTDDLIMKGITDYADGASAAVMAIQAGNDLLCCTDYETQVPAVIEAVKNGEISEERIDESLYRILSMKIDLGLITY